jgi:hypothetical protein
MVGADTMNIIITEWALQSYVDLKRQNVFTWDDYKKTLRPDVELLKGGIPSPHAKFSQANFWSPAVGLGGVVVKDGFKMKWHNLGPGRVQLRLLVALVGGNAFLCDAYVKSSDAVDKRFIAKFKNRIRDIYLGQYAFRGSL